ncbi:hypothetical protein B0A52_04792 [Exophiala mesophila]|uniref:SnoaL-like domain-containing protein n=1 Tax=Exophiala mesophila TaxID=212818 RepID=A0A438N656_EXOME|nr:hypothetical protein B0A52_04792 [Exophiala mesophila]
MSAVIDKPEVVADELAIRSLVARFANSCSPPDYDAFAKLWVPEQTGKAIWTLTKPFEMSATGVDEISKMLDRLLSTREFFVQLVHSGVVEVDGGNATGRWILREVARGPGETYYNNFAIYEDRYVKSEGKWYFERRDYKYMFLDSSPFQGDSFPLAPR